METIEVSKLIPHSDNNKYFDDITGDNWTEFLKSIKTSGVIEPIVVNQDYVIVSGHQRVKACKELGITEIDCKIRNYEPTEQWTIEDVILKELIETNLRQRGTGNNNAIKMAKCIVELERLYGIERGGNRGNQYSKKEAKGDNPPLATQKDLADNIGIGQDQIKAYKKLLTLIPELQDLVETGELKATTAHKVWAKLSEDEQKDFLDRLGDEKIITMSGEDTKKEIEKLKTENKKLKTQLDKPVEPTVIDNTNYEEIDTLKAANEELVEKLKNQSEQEPIITQVEVVPDDYEDIKQKLETISKEKEDLQLQLNSTDNKAEIPQQFTATSFIHSIERFGDYCYHFGMFLKKQDNVTQEQAEGYLHYVEMAKKNIKVLEDSVKEFVEDNTDISPYVAEDELDWNELMQETVPEKEPEEDLPESIRMTREMMKDEFDDDIENEPVESSTDEPKAPTVELDSVEVRTKILAANPDMTLSQYFLMELNTPKREFYRQIEKSLGMYDDNDKLAIPHADYIKFMTAIITTKPTDIVKIRKQVKALQK